MNSIMVTPSPVPVQQVPAPLQPSPVNRPAVVSNFQQAYNAYTPIAQQLAMQAQQQVPPGTPSGGGGANRYPGVGTLYGRITSEGNDTPITPPTTDGQPMGPPTPNSQGPWQSGNDGTGVQTYGSVSPVMGPPAPGGELTPQLDPSAGFSQSAPAQTTSYAPIPYPGPESLAQYYGNSESGVASGALAGPPQSLNYPGVPTYMGPYESQGPGMYAGQGGYYGTPGLDMSGMGGGE